MAWSDKVDDAMCFAHALHRDQIRKGSGVPYMSHLMGVAALVGDHGGSEQQLIAALLHDAIEDQAHKHEDLPQEIASRYGQAVLTMVLALSDATTHPKPPWQQRKRAYIEHIDQAADDDPALLVSVCDKLYNARTLLRDMNLLGLEVFERFKPEPEQTLWYYDSLAEAFLGKRWASPLQRAAAVSLRETVDAMQARHATLAA